MCLAEWLLVMDPHPTVSRSFHAVWVAVRYGGDSEKCTSYVRTCIFVSVGCTLMDCRFFWQL